MSTLVLVHLYKNASSTLTTRQCKADRAAQERAVVPVVLLFAVVRVVAFPIIFRFQGRPQSIKILHGGEILNYPLRVQIIEKKSIHLNVMRPGQVSNFCCNFQIFFMILSGFSIVT